MSLCALAPFCSDRGFIRHGSPSARAGHQGVSYAVGWTHKPPEIHRHSAPPGVCSVFHIECSCLCHMYVVPIRLFIVTLAKAV